MSQLGLFEEISNLYSLEHEISQKEFDHFNLFVVSINNLFEFLGKKQADLMEFIMNSTDFLKFCYENLIYIWENNENETAFKEKAMESIFKMLVLCIQLDEDFCLMTFHKEKYLKSLLTIFYKILLQYRNPRINSYLMKFIAILTTKSNEISIDLEENFNKKESLGELFIHQFFFLWKKEEKFQNNINFLRSLGGILQTSHTGQITFLNNGFFHEFLKKFNVLIDEYLLNEKKNQNFIEKHSFYMKVLIAFFYESCERKSIKNEDNEEKLDSLTILFDLLYKLFRIGVKKPEILPLLIQIIVNFANHQKFNRIFFARLCNGTSKLLLNDMISYISRFLISDSFK